ncbi:hypothetical protein LTR37_017672 [Vermiconidia calcicola]|uniref:Uncharacterized protein n=1 Tax=Vermiconidia calcicola TaxID=1690605 RepID=A0ACC3MJD6_9PEZI|nr:hypothetical protein LTR37_017672 [Vermiconidia calcicola]
MTLKIEGLDMFKRCARMICLDQPYNHAILMQAQYCIHRPGQTVPQRVSRYRTQTWAGVERNLVKKQRNIELLTNDHIRALLRNHFDAGSQVATYIVYNDLGAVVEHDAAAEAT